MAGCGSGGYSARRTLLRARTRSLAYHRVSMLRKLFTLVSALSLLLCAATAILAVRSYWVSDEYGFSTSTAAATDRGCLIVSRVSPDRDFGAVELGYHREAPSSPEDPINPRRVFRRPWNIIVAHGEEFLSLRRLVVPLWAPLIIVSVLPATWILATLRQWS